MPPRQLPSLPFHLTLQAMLYAASSSALQQAKLASQSSNANWPDFAKLFQADPEKLEAAVLQELRNQNVNLLSGIHHYLRHDYERPPSEAMELAAFGGSRLLDYGVEGKEKASVFFVPSLINRYYILDLMKGRSLIAHLRRHGIRAFVMDWGDPGYAENGFSLADYISRKLEPALEVISRTCSSPLVLSGYCMGGLLALALALRHEHSFIGLALLAMPWDFHAPGFPRVPLDDGSRGKLESIIARDPVFSGDNIQTLFYAANPWVFARKFSTFDQLSPPADAEFVAIESWVNDNVGMASPVARECLLDWVQSNKPVRGQWKVEGQPVLPDALSLPVFAACPTQDTIVPPGSAEAVLASLPHSTVCRPLSGHVGMLAGPRAEKELWHPLTLWIESLLRA